MEINQRKSIYDNLSKYCYLSDNDDCIEITAWANGEGYDINIINKNDNKIFSITEGQLKAINFLVNCLRYKEDV